MISLLPLCLSSSSAPWVNVQLYIINLTSLLSVTVTTCHEVCRSHGSASLSLLCTMWQSGPAWERTPLPFTWSSWWLLWMSSLQKNLEVCVCVRITVFQWMQIATHYLYTFFFFHFHKATTVNFIWLKCLFRSNSRFIVMRFWVFEFNHLDFLFFFN